MKYPVTGHRVTKTVIIITVLIVFAACFKSSRLIPAEDLSPDRSVLIEKVFTRNGRTISLIEGHVLRSDELLLEEYDIASDSIGELAITGYLESGESFCIAVEEVGSVYSSKMNIGKLGGTLIMVIPIGLTLLTAYYMIFGND